MPDPRAILDFTHINPETVTFSIDNSTITYDAEERDGSASVGLAVMLSGNGTIALCSDGSRVLGRLQFVEYDGKATVQTGGYMKLPGGDGATLTAGEAVVGDLGAASARGYIRNVATGTAAELGHSHGCIIDASTATAVVVRL